MSKQYFRRVEMVNGGPFKCPNCNKLLVKKVGGSMYELQLECPRCKTELILRCKEPIPFLVAEHAPV